MKIEVRLFANLAEFLPPRSQADRASMEVPDGSTVGDVTRSLGIPPEMPRIVLVNGIDAGSDRLLGPDDIVTLFPPLAGGA